MASKPRCPVCRKPVRFRDPRNRATGAVMHSKCARRQAGTETR